jgi:uncharacterized protein
MVRVRVLTVVYTIMLILLSKSPTTTVTAFRSAAACSTRRQQQAAASSLPAKIGNLFDDLQRTFSSATGGMVGSSNNSNKKFYTIGITGAGGLVGTALRDELSRRPTVNGKPVRIVRLARGNKAEAMTATPEAQLVVPQLIETTLMWNPAGSSPDDTIHPTVVQELDTIVHLSGENVATGQGPLGFLGIRPWTAAKKADILQSRVQLTTALAQVVVAAAAGTSNNRRNINLLTASGVGVYGNDFIGTAREAVDESVDTTKTLGFLAEVSRAWEGATAKAEKAGGGRVVNMRFGVVLSTKGGALAKLYPIFLLGGGGIVGSGQQYWSFISARDIARAIIHTIETPALKGPVNLCSPQPCTGADFTSALGKALGRPTILPLPGFAVSLLFGEMGDEMLLGGVRTLPTKLLKSGFNFLHPSIEEAIASAIEDNI